MKNLFKYTLGFFLLLLLGACAKQVAPTGGPKDTDPPKIESSEPLNYSTNFVGVTIKLQFDEFVVARNFKEQLVASPPFRETPELKIKGKTATLLIKDTLRENTTYTINFGSGIVDLTEGNPLDSNIFVFSTGDYLDSLSFSGNVRQAFDLKPAEEVYVMMYDDPSDSIPCKERPTYFTKADKQGNFTFNNLASGDYQLFALQDANNNYLFDQPNEAIAFPGPSIDPAQPDTVPIQLNMFQEDSEKQYVKRAKAEHFGKLMFVFNRPSDELRIQPTNYSGKKAWYIEERLTNGDSIVLWLTDVVPDTLNFVLYDGNTALDTVKISIPERKTQVKGKLKKNQVSLSLKSNHKGGGYPFFKTLRFIASNPVKSYPEEITLMEDSVAIQVPFRQIDPALRKFEVDYAFKQEVKYEVKFPPNSFTDIFNLNNDSSKVKFTTKTERDYGQFVLEFQGPDKDHPYILQLLTERGDLVQERVIGSNTKLDFLNLDPGKYRLKLIYDVNGNGEWDTGSYGEKRQPEKIIFYQEPLEVRAGWDLDISWTVTTEG